MTQLSRFSCSALQLLTAWAVIAAPSNQSAADEAQPAKPAAEAASPAANKDATKYELRYKCAIGDVWRYEQSHKSSIRGTIDEKTEAAQSKTDSVKAWKIIDVLADGTIEFTVVVEKVHMVNQLADKDPTEFDSQRDTTPPPGYEELPRSIGVPLSMLRMTPYGKILRREVKVKRPGAEDESPTLLLPEQPVAVGDSWDEPIHLTVVLKTGGTKGVQTRRHHTLAKVENNIATITVNYQVLTPIDAHIEAQLVERLMDGEARFDIDAGRILSRKLDVDKRILGFAGPTSSLQYVVRIEEKLVFAPHKITAKPADRPVEKVANVPQKPATAPTPATAAPKTTPSAPTRTATRPTRPAEPSSAKRR